AASGTKLFVSGAIIDKYGLALETGAPLRVFDVTSLATPKLAGESRDLAGPVSGVATDGSVAYVVDPPFFRVVDISKTSAPRDNAAYIFEIGGIRVVDISDRANAVIAKDINLAGRAAEIIDATATHPELLLVYSPTGLQLFTLANPFDPIMSGSLQYPQGGSIAASGDTVWFALPGTIDQIDVSNPAHPSVSSTAMRVTSPMQMAAAGRKIVIADRYSLRIYGPDTAAPAPPSIPKRRVARAR